MDAEEASGHTSYERRELEPPTSRWICFILKTRKVSAQFDSKSQTFRAEDNRIVLIHYISDVV